jgi:hypothetical protein
MFLGPSNIEVRFYAFGPIIIIAGLSYDGGIVLPPRAAGSSAAGDSSIPLSGPNFVHKGTTSMWPLYSPEQEKQSLWAMPI